MPSPPCLGAAHVLLADVRSYTRFTQQHCDESAARFAALADEGMAQHDGWLLESCWARSSSARARSVHPAAMKATSVALSVFRSAHRGLSSPRRR